MTDGREPEVVVVTGASAGVGRAVVREVAKRGAQIGLLARGQAGLEGAKRDVEERGGRAVIVPTDVSDPEAVEAAAARVEEEFGPIDIWINNAMNSVFSRVIEMEAEDYRRVTEVTYLGYVHGCLAALKRMVPRDRGVIINVGSALAYRGIPLQSAYCAAKHAITGFEESLRSELMHDGYDIRVTSVHLPAINTPQFRWVKSRLPNKSQPMPPIFQPEVAAEAIVFAMDSDRREIWVGWPTTRTIAGNRVASWFADRKLANEGIEGQQVDEAREERPHNLWEPVDGDEDHGARGAFGERASDRSLFFWANRNRSLLALVGAGLATAVAAGLTARSFAGEDEDGAIDRGVERITA